MVHHLPRVSECQNCGAPTGANFCPLCGQDARDHGVSLRVLFAEFARDVFTWDSRFFRSFVPLLFRPGALTEEYTRGRRVRFIPPLRLYLVVSLVFFFVISLQIDAELDAPPTGNAPPDSGTVALVLDMASALPDTLPGNQSAAGWVADRLPYALVDDFEVPPDGDWTSVDWASLERVPAGDDDTMTVSIFGDDFALDERTFFKTSQKLAPRFAFLLLPLFAGLLALAYVRRRRHFVEHLIHSLHLHSFVFLLAALIFLLDWDWGFLIAFALIHLYLYKSLRRVHAQSRRKTLAKFLFLTSAYNVVMFALLIISFISTAQLLRFGLDHPTLARWIIG